MTVIKIRTPSTGRTNVSTGVPFPALVNGAGPITVSKSNGIWTISFSVTQFATVAQSEVNGPNDFLLGYSSDTGTFFKTNISALLSAEPTVVTTGSATVAATSMAVAIQRVAPATTALALPDVGLRNGLPLNVVDFSTSVTSHAITLTPYGTQTIMTLSSWELFSSAASLAGVRLYPSTSLDGWYIAP